MDEMRKGTVVDHWCVRLLQRAVVEELEEAGGSLMVEGSGTG